MKTRLFICGILIGLFFISCDKDEPDNNISTTGSLKILVKKNNQYIIYSHGATINLYKSEFDKTNGIIYRSEKSDSLGNCSFTNLPVQLYYITGIGSANDTDYTGSGTSMVVAGMTIDRNLILEVKPPYGDLKIMVYKDNTSTPFTAGASITLYLTVEDMNLNIVYKTGTSGASGDYLFKDLPIQQFWIKAVGSESGNDYSGYSTATTLLDKEVVISLVLLQVGGELEVFVFKDFAIGTPVSAVVNLYLSKQDMNAGNVYQNTTSPGGYQGAMFYSLQSQFYQVKAEFDFADYTYTGIDSVFIPASDKIILNIICVK